MLDIKLIRTQPDLVRERLALRSEDDANQIPRVLDLDVRHRSGLTRVEQIAAEVNSRSREIGVLMQSGRRDDATAIQEAVRTLKSESEALQVEVRQDEEALQAILSRLPNLLHESVPAGGEENNVVLRTIGEPKKFGFAPKPHWEIAESLGLIDFARGAKLAGSGFVLYRGDGALLERGLIQFMIDIHVTEHGYTEWSTPFLLNRDSVTASGHIVKFTPEMYHDAEDDLFALPTAEPALVNIHRGEFIEESALPLNYVAYSPCWRREAGAAGKDTRGLLRVHQFDKVEMVKLTTAETSYDEMEKMLRDAINIVARLGLTYRVLTLAAGDVSFAMAKTYDVEIYSPGVDRWLEVSSVSNGTDFQARRGNIRYRSAKDGNKPQFAHILNGSGTALPRLVAALLETYQQEDGSVELPEVLKQYLRGKTRLG
jgi:seryl-tRNA synthetase